MKTREQFELEFKSMYLLILEMQNPNEELFEYFDGLMGALATELDFTQDLNICFRILNKIRAKVIEHMEVFDEQEQDLLI